MFRAEHSVHVHMNNARQEFVIVLISILLQSVCEIFRIALEFRKQGDYFLFNRLFVQRLFQIIPFAPIFHAPFARQPHFWGSQFSFP